MQLNGFVTNVVSQVLNSDSPSPQKTQHATGSGAWERIVKKPDATQGAQLLPVTSVK
jgi:hypothetical protein